MLMMKRTPSRRMKKRKRRKIKSLSSKTRIMGMSSTRREGGRMLNPKTLVRRQIEAIIRR
jgi:hypothetical protein